MGHGKLVPHDTLLKVALFVGFGLAFGISELNGEGAIEATLRFCANPKHTIAASVGGFDGFFEILH